MYLLLSKSICIYRYICWQGYGKNQSHQAEAHTKINRKSENLKCITQR